MNKILTFFKPYWVEISLIALFLFGRSMSELALPQYMSNIINDGIIKQDMNYISKAGLIMLGLTLLSIILATGGNFFATRVSSATSRDIRASLFHKVTSLSPFELETLGVSSLITRSTNDVQMIQQASMATLRMALYAGIMGIGALIKAFQTSPSMTWTIGLALVSILLVLGIVFLIVFPKFEKIQTLLDQLNLVVGEQLSGLPVIRAFNAQQREEDRLDQTNAQLMNTNIFIGRYMAFLIPILMGIMNGTSLLILWSGAHKVSENSLLVGDILAFLQYSMQVILSALFVMMLFIMLPRAAVSANRIKEVLVFEPSIVQQGLETSSPASGELSFEQVSFSYENAEEKALSNITFTAKPGTVTGIIGSTGSGKSTLLHLIPRFFNPTKGRITLGGKDIQKMSLSALRQSIGFIPQKGQLFSGTIRSNLTFGKADATEMEMEEALRNAEAFSFVDKLPQKYDTPVSQGGTSVSGGEKQRLSISRALLKKAPLYLFDDSFSALDFHTDRQLRKNLKAALKQATLLIVAQRVNTIVDADNIIVLNEGKIVGQGTHEQLLGNCQIYKEIAYSQLDEKDLRRIETIKKEASYGK